ncbi:MAG: MotA/TolQ/ExbB proton channel family protein [Planctomycetota bacterium]
MTRTNEMLNWNRNTFLAVGLLAAALPASARPVQDETKSFDEVQAELLQKLEQAQQELNAVRERATDEKLPLNKRLSELERELVEAEAELQSVTRDANESALKLSNLNKLIGDRKAQSDYLSNLFTEYGRNFESRLHVAELERYGPELEAARLAPENTNLSQAEVFAEQAKLLDVSIDRLMEMGGGSTFEGTAVDAAGNVREGRFVVAGPVALFRSKDGGVVGTAEQQLGSVSPAIREFSEPEDAAATALLVESGGGLMPFDASLGNAHKIAATKETLVEHVSKGGVVMYPILIMAALALLVALYKWISFMFIKKPSKKALDGLMEAVQAGDEDSARRRAREIKGPTGSMLEVGVDNIRRSRDLIEEVMYEKVLVAKSKVNRALPFIAVCAASAPLLGLLGTVTGIINTFKQITVFGSGDVKQLSGGISEALITTKFGLIVAIPSLLLHAYLYRKARGVITQMETSAVRFANEVEKSEVFGQPHLPSSRVGSLMTPDHELVRGQVAQVLTDMLGPLSNEPEPAQVAESPASGNTNSAG